MKVESAKKAVSDMIFYYQYALLQEGIKNPKEHILESVGEMLNATEEEIEHIKLNMLQGNKFIENLDSSILLLQAMEESKSLDMESLKIVKSILELSRTMAKQSLKKVIERSNNDL